jgi:hypothetical protein
VTATRPLRIVVHDTAERGWPWLGVWWAIGARVLSGAGVVIGARSWEEAYDKLAEIDRPVDLVSVWGHGTAGKPLIDGRAVDLVQLGQALRTVRPTSEIWWRSCEVHRGAVGHRFAEDVTRIVGCVSVGHTHVISAPNPLVQRGICALRPGETPWWPHDGRGLPGCLTTRMTVPPKAYGMTT